MYHGAQLLEPAWIMNTHTFGDNMDSANLWWGGLPKHEAYAAAGYLQPPEVYENVIGIGARSDASTEEPESSSQENDTEDSSDGNVADGVYGSDDFTHLHPGIDCFGTMPENDDKVSTVMIKNIPCRCRQEEVLEAIDACGFRGLYDFFYLPIRRSQRQNYGYAFISFKDPAVTALFCERMVGFAFGSRRSSKTLSVVPARIQGLSDTLTHFSNTRVLNSQWSPIFVTDEAKARRAAEQEQKIKDDLNELLRVAEESNHVGCTFHL